MVAMVVMVVMAWVVVVEMVVVMVTMKTMVMVMMIHQLNVLGNQGLGFSQIIPRYPPYTHIPAAQAVIGELSLRDTYHQT